MNISQVLAAPFFTHEITVLNNDFEHAVMTAERNSFIYFDPLYHGPDKPNFTGCQTDIFNEDEQKRLRNSMIKMTGRVAKRLLSDSGAEYIRELYNYKFFDIIVNLLYKTEYTWYISKHGIRNDIQKAGDGI
ncbi:MAG: DNA adenine methylase [Treponema sp.]|nr:DNA adenine methylase [Treponema sp.]